MLKEFINSLKDSAEHRDSAVIIIICLKSR